MNPNDKSGGLWIEHVQSRDILKTTIIKSVFTYNDGSVETNLCRITRWSFKVAYKDECTVMEKYHCGGDDRTEHC